MDAAARALLQDRTSHSRQWPIDELISAKRASGASVSVVLPALNEAETVGEIVATIRAKLMELPGHPLVDELVVIDSGSTDATAEVAATAGAQVVAVDAVFPEISSITGKGEAMWRGLAATSGDLVVFIDADLRSFSPHYITGLLGPLLNDPDVHMVKAVYDRPLVLGDAISTGGGRVTELVARPLLNLYWPGLAGVIQPLAGEYAARRSLLEQLAFPCGYGVDFALLVDTAQVVGVRGIAQVDLGVRLHRHHDDQRLGRMAAEILQTAWSRLGDLGRLRRDGGIGTTLTQFALKDGSYAITDHDVAGLERPPLLSLSEYARTG
jgi:glucosyl-3-phosphoglycerate synthase